jgi:hypothetical protein
VQQGDLRRVRLLTIAVPEGGPDAVVVELEPRGILKLMTPMVARMGRGQ